MTTQKAFPIVRCRASSPKENSRTQSSLALDFERAALIFSYSLLKFNRHIKLYHDSGLYPNLRPLEIIIKAFLYNLRLMTLKFNTGKFKTLRTRGNPDINKEKYFNKKLLLIKLH